MELADRLQILVLDVVQDCSYILALMQIPTAANLKPYFSPNLLTCRRWNTLHFEYKVDRRLSVNHNLPNSFRNLRSIAIHVAPHGWQARGSSMNTCITLLDESVAVAVKFGSCSFANPRFDVVQNCTSILASIQFSRTTYLKLKFSTNPLSCRRSSSLHFECQVGCRSSMNRTSRFPRELCNALPFMWVHLVAASPCWTRL